MALTKCKECGHDIAKSAKACPSCGAVVKRTGCLTMGLAIFFGFVILSIAIGSFQKYSQTSSDAGQSPATPQADARQLAAPMSSNPGHDQLMTLSNPERNTMFTKLMASSEQECGTVTNHFYQGSDQKAAYWNVECVNGSAYVIQINADSQGSTSVMDCAVLKAVGGGECFKKF